MQRIRHLLIPVLASVVSLAGITCVCAAPVSEPATGPAPHHAHHQDTGMAGEPECVDSGCGGSGGLDAAVAERAGAAVPLPETSFDDNSHVSPAPAGLPRRLAVTHTGRSPPPDLRRAPATPVSRFDKLLN
ncbi:MAG: hypothetical protein OXU72_04805 [Gammaproteobacteria bacterium]|nr:hypothetical protein [Gammaproteobacteria bacterium]